MEKNYFVYLTTNILTNKQYIGSHYGNINDGYLGSGVIINNSIKKYKKINHKIEILKICNTRKEAFDLEEFYIKQYNTIKPFGYNLSPTGGMNEWGGSHSIETKKLLSEKRKGKEPWNKGKVGIYSDETIQKMKNNCNNKGINNPMYGKKGNKSPIYGIKKTQLHKEKLSNSKKGSKNPNACKYKIITPDNKTIIVNSAAEFPKLYPIYGINRHFIYTAEKSKQIYKGWKITKY